MIGVDHLRTARITNESIIYKWWIQKAAALTLINSLLPYLKLDNIKKRTINNTEYYLLYIGKAKNGQERLVDYHILDKNNFHEKGVENGRLSSLRQTLCALLHVTMSLGKEPVDSFMNNNCLVEYELVNLDDILTHEKQLIIDNYPVLNSQHTKSIFPKEHRKMLRELKKRYRQ